MKRLALAVALLIALAVPAWADFQAGADAYWRGDYVTALLEFKPLAEKGHAKAQLALGVMYELGRGVPQDSAEAVKLYHKAAEQGHAAAQYDLGLMYHKGHGVPQDYVQAHVWYNLAALRSEPGADQDISVKNRDIIAEKMTPAQIAEAEKLVREWKPKRE